MLGSQIIPKNNFYIWEYFFEHISLITLKKSELLYIWVTDYSQE